MKITKAELRKLTDPRSWERGVGYFEDGRARSLLRDGATVVAKVDGTWTYRVTLWLEEGQLEAECTCPMGDAGVFCKHCVAVGLACLDSGISELSDEGVHSHHGSGGATPVTTLDDVRTYLLEQDTLVLAQIIVEQAMWDDRLRSKLLLRAAGHARKGLDAAAIRNTINQATAAGDFVDYHSAGQFAAGIDDVVDFLAELLAGGHAEELIGLTEHAFERVEAALGYMDDSDGHMGSILDRLQELHHAACLEARPEPVLLAHRLFQWEMTTDWDTFYGAAETYADVLGEAGMASYRKLAEAEWQKMPPLAPGESEQTFLGHRFRLTSIMESLALADDDLEALVAVKSRDLSSAYCYLDIAQTYKGAGKRNEALKWAEEGLKAFPQRTDRRLREFVADGYHRRRRHDEAMTLVWANFADWASLEAYGQLKEHAKRARQWSEWRQKALSHIRKQSKGRKTGAAQDDWVWAVPTARSLLVDIFLWEKDVEAAWQEAHTGGCSADRWLKLAALREKDNPADAIPIYRVEIDSLVQRTNNAAYRDAMDLIRKVRKLMKRLGRQEEFTEYVEALRTEHKRKRNFIAMLARLK